MADMPKPVVEYEIWEQRPKGVLQRRGYPSLGLSQEEATSLAQEFNQDEDRRARQERRRVTVRYFVVRATTTFEEI